MLYEFAGLSASLKTLVQELDLTPSLGAFLGVPDLGMGEAIPHNQGVEIGQSMIPLDLVLGTVPAGLTVPE